MEVPLSYLVCKMVFMAKIFLIVFIVIFLVSRAFLHRTYLINLIGNEGM